MKNFFGIKLSEPFTFRLYEDCGELAKYASDNCLKLDEVKMALLAEIVLDEPGKDKEGKPYFPNNIDLNEDIKNSKVHRVYQEIVNFKEGMLESKCLINRIIKKFFCRQGDKEDYNVESYKTDVKYLESLYSKFSMLLTSEKIGKLAQVHAYLSGLATPATAATIIFTKPTVNFPFTKSISTIPFMRNLMLGSIWAVIVFVISFILTIIPEENIIKIVQPVLPDILKFGIVIGKKATDCLVSLSAALLGAYFYSLHTANRYFINRTFDRKYVTYYNVRVVIGMISGFILANFVGVENYKNSGFEKVSFILIAIVGGFSAEAVMVLLKRIMATILTLVKGDMNDIVESKEKEYKEKAEIANRQYKMNKYKDLLDFYNKSKDDLPLSFKDKFNDLLKNFES